MQLDEEFNERPSCPNRVGVAPFDGVSSVPTLLSLLISPTLLVMLADTGLGSHNIATTRHVEMDKYIIMCV